MQPSTLRPTGRSSRSIAAPAMPSPSRCAQASPFTPTTRRWAEHGRATSRNNVRTWDRPSPPPSGRVAPPPAEGIPFPAPPERRMAEKHFTLEEADQPLPRLRAILEQLVAVRREMGTKHHKME